jgi:DNA-binding IclR family transcriptional regulator
MSPERAPAPFRGREPGAIDNAFAIIEEVARSGAGVSAREIAANLGMPRSTAYRILKHLVQQEYLVRTPDLLGFAPGQRVRDLARAIGSAAPADPAGAGG